MQLGDYQSTSSPGFIFGLTFASVLLVLCLTLLIWKGQHGNDKYSFGLDEKLPVLTAIFRFCMLVYALVVYAYFESAFSFGYFTVWNWLLITLYLFLGVTVSFTRLLKIEDPQARKPEGFLRHIILAQQIVGEIELPFSIFVLVLVWGYLAPSSGWAASYVEYESISMHAINAFIMLVDFFLAGWLINPWHFGTGLIFASLYVIWHLSANAAWGMMAYPFMATDNNSFIIWIIGLAVLDIVFFYIFFGFSLLKVKCMGKTLEPEEEADHRIPPIGADPPTAKIVESDPSPGVAELSHV